MTVTHFYSAKGGQGVTTLAAIAAIADPRVSALVDAAPYPDVPAVTGCAAPASWAEPAELATDWIDLDQTTRAYRYRDGLELAELAPAVYVDHGCRTRGNDAGRWVLVTRACYVALRRAVLQDARPDAIVLIREDGRALQTRDVEATIGAPVIAELAVSPMVARCIDAGLLAVGRIPTHAANAVRTLAELEQVA